METMHLLIKGKVQCVFYRATARRKAVELGLTGWIKNTAGGDVECLVSGTRGKLQTFIEWCKKGPEKAVVSEVIATPKEPQSFAAFEIVR